MLAKAGGVLTAVISVPVGIFGLFALTLAVSTLARFAHPANRIDITAAIVFLVLGLLCLLVSIRWLSRGLQVAVKGESRGTRMMAVVSDAAASQHPYPFVFVNADGSARELHPAERGYLETPFAGSDGGRPYVKSKYDSRDGWGSIAGFLPRLELPEHLSIGAAPADDPSPHMDAEEYTSWLIQRIAKSEGGDSK